jgi:hypothetical protein
MPTIRALVTAAVFATSSLASAQETQQLGSQEAVSAPDMRVAVPRAEPNQGARIQRPVAAAGGQRREERRGAPARRSDGSAGTEVRRREPRQAPSSSPPPRHEAGPRTTDRRHDNARRSHPPGSSTFGFRLYLGDPFTWSPADRYGSYYSGGQYQEQPYHPRTGDLRLRVEPRYAEVHVDGYYAGLVSDFDGIAQGLRLEEGPYTIEIVARDHEPLAFGVRILPGRQVTYRGALRPYRIVGQRRR